MDKETVKSFANEAGNKAKELAFIAKYQALIQKETAKIKREYYRLGKKYYQLFSDTPDLDLIKYTDEINTLNAKVEAYKSKIEDLKSGKAPSPKPEPNETDDSEANDDN